MIRRTGRYAAHGPKVEFEPGSRGRVLHIAAIHAAMGGNYEPMSALFSAVIRRSYDRLARSGR